MMKTEPIKALEEKIADLKKRWPAHSVPGALVQELDDLEEALEEEYARLRQENADA